MQVFRQESNKNKLTFLNSKLALEECVGGKQNDCRETCTSLLYWTRREVSGLDEDGNRENSPD